MSDADHEEIWHRVGAGESLTDIGRVIGRSLTTVRDFVARNGGKRPEPPTEWSEHRLSLAEREEISRGLAADYSFQTIAARIGRAPSTVSREVNANGGWDAYRAVDADANARERAKRPKPTRLATSEALRTEIEVKLNEYWTPEQIAAWLRTEHPDDPDMSVSHESIYVALYAGVLRVKPQRCLRTRRTLRRRRNRRRNHGPGVIKDPVMIGQRPAQVADRLEPGHWEGDLIIGNRSTAMATLVERMTRYTILVQLPGRRTMDALNTGRRRRV